MSEFVVTEGQVYGHCPKCAEPALGKFDCDGQEQLIKIECVNCNTTEIFSWLWPDDLPKFHIKKVKKGTRKWKLGMKLK